MARVRKYTRESYIEAVKKVHGDAYNYANTKYTGIGKTVRCDCPEHGEFHLQAITLLSPSSGCPKCKKSSKVLPREELLNRFREKHGDKFDYTHVPDRVRFKDKVKIICPIHGAFTQEVRVHAGISKYGCPRCASYAVSEALRKQDYSTRNKKTVTKKATSNLKVVMPANPTGGLTWKPTK